MRRVRYAGFTGDRLRELAEVYCSAADTYGFALPTCRFFVLRIISESVIREPSDRVLRPARLAGMVAMSFGTAEVFGAGRRRCLLTNRAAAFVPDKAVSPVCGESVVRLWRVCDESFISGGRLVLAADPAPERSRYLLTVNGIARIRLVSIPCVRTGADASADAVRLAYPRVG